MGFRFRKRLRVLPGVLLNVGKSGFMDLSGWGSGFHLELRGEGNPDHGTSLGLAMCRIADEVISHVAGLVGATVKVTLEIEAEIPGGAPDHVVRAVIENRRQLRFASQGFESE